MPANRNMPATLGMNHGMAIPMAYRMQATRIGGLRRLMASDSGPEMIAAMNDTIMVMMAMMEMAFAASVLLRPMWSCRMYSWYEVIIW